MIAFYILLLVSIVLVSVLFVILLVEKDLAQPTEVVSLNDFEHKKKQPTSIKLNQSYTKAVVFGVCKNGSHTSVQVNTYLQEEPEEESDQMTADDWHTVQKKHTFTSPSQQEENFGCSVAVSNMFVFIGASQHSADNIKNSGVVYVFRKDNCALFKTIFPPVLKDDQQFGTFVEVFENHVQITDGHGELYRVECPTSKKKKQEKKKESDESTDKKKRLVLL